MKKVTYFDTRRFGDMGLLKFCGIGRFCSATKDYIPQRLFFMRVSPAFVIQLPVSAVSLSSWVYPLPADCSTGNPVSAAICLMEHMMECHEISDA